MVDFGIDYQDILDAHARIKNHIIRSPMIKWEADSKNKDKKLFLKLETVQPTGSFKIRGSANKLLKLSGMNRNNGVITVSSGNHGRALAYMAKFLGIKSTICVSTKTPAHKILAIQKLGGNVVIQGEGFDQAEANAYDLMKELGSTYVSSYDDPDIIAGAGTIGLEIIQDYPEVDSILVPVGGGGLAAGIALAAREVSRKIQVIGVSMDRAPVMYHSLQAGHLIQMIEETTIADALKGGLGSENGYTFRICQALLDDFLILPDEDIEKTMASLLMNHRIIVEGGGAVALAAALKYPQYLGTNSVAVLTGSSVDIEIMYKIYKKYQTA